MSISDASSEAKTAPPGQEWLPWCPEDWRLERMKAVFREISVKGEPNLPLLAATQKMGVVRKETYGQRTVVAQQGLENLKVVEVDDFVISLRSFEGGIEVAHDRGIISPAYTVLRARETAYRGYFRHLLKSRYFLDAIRLSVTGIREGQSINYAKLGCTFLPLPPRCDAALIVRYLDHAELRITKAIAGKNEVLAKLQEAKTSVISELVLGDQADRIDTGVPGLGSVPSHWRLQRAKYVWRAVDVRSATGTEERLTVSSAHGIVPRSSTTVMMFEAASYVGHKVVRPGNLVINSLWSWATGLGVSNHYGIVSPVYGVYALIDDECDVAYLDHLLRSNACQWQFQVRSKGIWRSRLSLTDEAFLDMMLVLPPLEEQREIARRIGERTAAIDAAMDAVNGEIALLKEYRTRLISDVVTGKIDVREEAAKLPDIDPAELAAVLAGGAAGADEEEVADGDD